MSSIIRFKTKQFDIISLIIIPNKSVINSHKTITPSNHGSDTILLDIIIVYILIKFNKLPIGNRATGQLKKKGNRATKIEQAKFTMKTFRSRGKNYEVDLTKYEKLIDF